MDINVGMIFFLFDSFSDSRFDSLLDSRFDSLLDSLFDSLCDGLYDSLFFVGWMVIIGRR